MIEKCRECGGEGGGHVTRGLPSGYADCYTEWENCDRCRGSGEEPQTAPAKVLRYEDNEWWDHYYRQRQQRLEEALVVINEGTT